MKDGKQRFKIISYDPNLDQEHFSKLEDAYLKLFNENESLKYLSHSQLPFNSRTVSSFLKNALQEGVEYYVAISDDDYHDKVMMNDKGVTPENEIIGLSAFKSDPINGFEIIGTVVHEDHRLRGIGNALIEKGVLLGKTKGFKAVDIAVFADNRSMLILLLKMGFKPTRMENHARSDGEDLIYLKKYL